VPASQPLLPVCNFRVFIGRREIGFCQVEGLASDTLPPDEFGEQADTWGPVVLRRAVGADKSLFRWRERTVEGRRDRRDVVIDQHEVVGGKAVNTWVLVGAWIARWSGPALNACANDVAIEEIELGCERVLWLDKAGSRPGAARKRQRKEGARGRSS
jgi:hypothetical protein